MTSRLRSLVLLAALRPALLLPAGPRPHPAATPTAQQLYDSLPQQEREPFLAYELALGLEQVAGSEALLSAGAARAIASLSPAPDAGHARARSGSLADRLHHLYGIPPHLLLKFQNLPTPSDFDINMYVWVKTSTNPTFAQMLQLAATGQYCVGARCFSLQEPWGHCCPF